MVKILLWRVAGFNQDQLLTSQVSGLRGRNTPFGQTRIPMPYPNIIKQKSPQVYPLSTPVKGVDGEV